MIKKILIVILTFTIFGFSCASIYTATRLSDNKPDYRSIAIMPFKVTYTSSKKNVDPDVIKEQTKQDSFNFQSAIYNKFLKKIHLYTIEFQDVDQTVTLLEKAGIPYGDYSKYTTLSQT